MRGSHGFGISSCYLDQGTSNFTLSGNTCAKSAIGRSISTGAKALTITNDIFDISTLTESGPVSPAWGPCADLASGSAGADDAPLSLRSLIDLRVYLDIHAWKTGLRSERGSGCRTYACLWLNTCLGYQSVICRLNFAYYS